MAKDKTKTEPVAGSALKPPKRPKRRRKGAVNPALPRAGEPDAVKKKVKGGKAKQGRRRTKLIIIIAAVLLVLIIAGGAAFVMINNTFDLRDKVFDYIYTLDPRDRAREKLLEERQNDIDISNLELDGREAGIKEREDELDQRENGIRSEEARLEKLEEELIKQTDDLAIQAVESLPRYLQPMTEEEIADLQNLAKIYSAMTSEQAAAILIELYSPQDRAAILYRMSTKSAAAILAAMDAVDAAELTEILLHE